jgi:hypothetical protein
MKPAVGHVKWLVAALAIRRSHCQRYARPLHVTTKSWSDRELRPHQVATPLPGLRPEAVVLRAAQNSGLACSSDRRAPDPLRQSADGCALWSRLETRCLRLPSPLRHNIFPPDARPLVRIWTRICAGDPVPLKPATLLPSSPAICRSGILKRLVQLVRIRCDGRQTLIGHRI